LAAVRVGYYQASLPLFGIPLFFLVFMATAAALHSSVRAAMVLVESLLPERFHWQPAPPPAPGEWL
jgi:hypothetical protein